MKTGTAITVKVLNRTACFYYAVMCSNNADDYCISFVIRHKFFPFQNNHKYLDLSYKTDLDFWDCF